MNTFETSYRGLYARDELVIWDNTLIIVIKDYKQHVQAKSNFQSLKRQATKKGSRTRAVQVALGPVKAKRGSKQTKMRKRVHRVIMGKLRRFDKEDEGGER